MEQPGTFPNKMQSPVGRWKRWGAKNSNRLFRCSQENRGHSQLCQYVGAKFLRGWKSRINRLH